MRRALWALDLTEAIEDGDLDELYDADSDQLVISTSDTDEDEQ